MVWLGCAVSASMLQVTLMSSWDAGTGVDWRLTKASGCSRLCSRARSIGISRQCKTAASVRSMRLGAAVIWGQTPAHWPRGAPGCSPAQAGRPSEPQATQRTDCAPSAGAHARPASLQRPPPQQYSRHYGHVCQPIGHTRGPLVLHITIFALPVGLSQADLRASSKPLANWGKPPASSRPCCWECAWLASTPATSPRAWCRRR